MLLVPAPVFHPKLLAPTAVSVEGLPAHTVADVARIDKVGIGVTYILLVALVEQMPVDTITV